MSGNSLVFSGHLCRSCSFNLFGAAGSDVRQVRVAQTILQHTTTTKTTTTTQ